MIKLRLKGTTKLIKLPSGVFRQMLEYMFPNEFTFRYSEPFAPIYEEQDKHFPSSKKFDYNNYLVALNEQ